MDRLSGRCMCGSVTWTYSGETTRNLVCHCADCQRATSSPFTAFLGVRPGQLHWAGEIEHYESSPGTHRGFCPPLRHKAVLPVAELARRDPHPCCHIDEPGRIPA